MSAKPFVLLADDNPSDAFLIRLAFEKAKLPCEVFFVPTGAEVIRYLAGEAPYADRAKFPLPNLIVLDLNMPGGNGFQVLEWLHARPGYSRVRVAVLSSSNDEQDLARARRLGASDYQIKPNDFRNLVRLARDLDTKWLNADCSSVTAAPA
jgi:CheY-like chemotaxis protein